MRILHVMEATIGGTRRHLVDVSRAQLARGHEVGVAASCLRTPAFERDLEQLEQCGARVHRIAMRREIAPRSDWAHLRQLERLLGEWRPAIVHTHSSKAGALGRLASLRTGIGARVHTPHTFAFLFGAMFSPARRALFREIERWLARRTAALVAVSEDERRTILASGIVPAHKLHVVGNGIDPAPLESAQALTRSELGVPERVPLLLCAGLLNAAKGQDLLVEALRDAGLEHVHLLLAGDGELRASLERHGLGARVRLLGQREDVPRLLKSVDALVLPSRWEGMPYIVLEALAAGTPVLATPVDGARSVLGASGAGLLAARIDAAAIAELLRAFLELSPARRAEMAHAGRQWARENATLEAMVRGLDAVYGALA
jgi:glycosyltransferase involved in cell wall biosynthesis